MHRNVSIFEYKKKKNIKSNYEFEMYFAACHLKHATLFIYTTAFALMHVSFNEFTEFAIKNGMKQSDTVALLK